MADKITFDSWVETWGLEVNISKSGETVCVEVFDPDQPCGSAWAKGKSEEEAKALLVGAYGSDSP